MALAVGVGAEQAEQVGAERAPGGPGLLAVEHPAAALVVARGPARERGQVAAGVRLAPALAPEVLAAGHAREDVGLLLGRAELEDRRGEQEDAVLRDPLRAAGPVVLLLEDQPLPQRGGPAAVLLGPGHHRPAVRRTASAPSRGAGRSPPRCRPTMLPVVAGAPRGQVLGQPGPGLGVRNGVLGRSLHSRSIRRSAPRSRVDARAEGRPRPRPRSGRSARPRSGPRRPRR